MYREMRSVLVMICRRSGSNSHKFHSRKLLMNCYLGQFQQTRRQFHSVNNNNIDKGNGRDDDKTKKKKGILAKIKGLWKEYGYKAVLCYASLYFLNLGGFAIALETDVLSLHDYGYDAQALLDMVCNKYEELTGRKELGEIIHDHPRYGILAISMLLTDLCEPLRIGATIFFLSRLAKKEA